MFCGFNVSLDASQFRKCFSDVKGGDALWESFVAKSKAKRGVIENEVKSKVMSGKWVINGADVESNWFPKIQNHVFISHSHQDEELALGLTGALKEWLNIDAFVDSSVWGYYRDLQKRLFSAVKGRTVNGLTKDELLELWNTCAAHVHCMLSKSLIQMMDQCECLLFLNTPASIAIQDIKANGSCTYSPWIYTEIEASRMLRTHRDPRRSQQGLIKESSATGKDAALECLVEYPLNLDHLTSISTQDVCSWIRNGCKAARATVTGGAFAALDVLYAAKS